MAEKRAFDSEGAQPASKSKAARFNAHILKKLQAAVMKDPEINLAEQFPQEYPQRLMEMRKPIESSPSKHHNTAIQSLLIGIANIIICQRKPNIIHRVLSRPMKTSDDPFAHQTRLKLCFLFRMRLQS
jgi:hypothetical protein